LKWQHIEELPGKMNLFPSWILLCTLNSHWLSWDGKDILDFKVSLALVATEHAVYGWLSSSLQCCAVSVSLSDVTSCN